MVRHRFIATAAVALAAATIASTAPAPAASKAVLGVLAATTARAAMPELIAAFQKTHDDVLVQATFGGSKSVISQINGGGLADVVLVGETTIEELKGKNEAPVRVMRNHTAIGVAPAAAAKVKAPKDLAASGVKIASGSVGSLTEAYQMSTVEALGKSLGKPFVDGYTANIASRASDAAKVAEAVRTNDADAAILFAADIQEHHLGMIPLAAGDSTTEQYVAAALKASAKLPAARDFVKFLGSPEAAAIFRKHYHD